MDFLLTDLSVVFVSAVLFGIILRFFKLPSLVGQVLAGFVVGYLGIISHETETVLRLLGSMGVTLLLFLVGLEMNWKEVRHSAVSALKIFVIQSLVIAVMFFMISTHALNMSFVSAIMFSIALTFSSTIVVVKILSENKDLSSFAGKISVGMLILQDLLAIFLLVLIPSLANGVLKIESLLPILLKLSVLFLTINIFGNVLIGKLMKHVIKGTEDLILFSLIWLLISVYLSVRVLGLTAEIGGILAGVSLASTWGHFQIVSKVKTLRDIFLTIFFVVLGFEVGTGVVNWGLVSVFLTMALLGKFVLTMFSALVSGLRRKIAFTVSLNMTQLSEFSLIVLTIGLTQGLFDQGIVSAVTVASLLSMVISTVLMTNAGKLYIIASRLFPTLIRLDGKKDSLVEMKDHVVLLGADRTGKSILSFLNKNKEKVVVVDFNPQVVKTLSGNGDMAIFADVSDPDVIDIASMETAKLIISTVKDINDSLALLTELKQRNIKVPIIVDAESASDAGELYKKGASYVIFPHFVSGLHLGQLIRKFEKDSKILSKYRDKQTDTLTAIYGSQF